MTSFAAINRLVLQRIKPGFQKRLVSTSKKNNDTVAAEVCKTTAKTEEKNWVSYGYDFKSKTEDRTSLHGILFTGVTLCMVVAGFVWAYGPDYNLRDWAVREAFLELRRREAIGAPLVDPNIIPPEKMVLPSDEELGDAEVII